MPLSRVMFLIARASGFSFLYLIFLNALSVSAQSPFQNPLILNSANGLPSNNLTKLVVDEEGFAWIGTDNGLARFDGITVETFLHNDTDSLSIRSNYIHDIATDLVHNKIWVGTPLGLSVLNTNDKTFTNYNYDPGNPFSVPDHQAFSILKDKNGVIWIGFKEGGLLQYRPETDDFKHWICDEYIPDSVSKDSNCSRSITGILEDTQNDSILWLGTKGITRFNKYTGVFQRYTFDTQNEELDYALGSIRNMLLHSNGIIYFGTWYHGVIAFDTRTKSFWQLQPCYQHNSTPFVRDVTTAIYPKSDDEIWISSVKGLQLYEISSNCITRSFVNDKSKKEWYSVNYIDKQDRIWSATSIDGLRIYNPLMQQFDAQYYEEVDHPYSGHTRKIIEDTIGCKLIVISLDARGIYVQDQLSQQWECILPPLDYNMRENGFLGFDGVLMDEGNVLVVADDGLFIYKPGFKRLQRYSLQPVHANPRLRNAIRTNDGYYWVTGYVEGLTRLDTKKQEVYNFEKDFLSAFNLSLGGDYLVEDQNGNIWIREHNGILIYEKASGQFIYHSYDPTNIRAYRGGGIMDADEEGRVWIATQREFLGYGHADSIALGGIRYFGKKDGLLGDNVWLVKSYQSKVLVFTNKYIQVFNPKTFQFEKNFAMEYGLGDYSIAASILSDDQLAIGKPKSFALFYPDSLKTNAEIPKPYVSSFRVFDNNWPLGNGIRKTDTIYLSYAENFFSFEFSAIGFNLPDQTTFRYQLEGFDENWQDGTKRKFAAYTNVPGGDYRFLVEALNSEGLSQGTPSITNVHISTVWYKTIWFWLAFAALLFGLVYLIARYRITQARKEERLKSDYESKLAEMELSALRAQMNPHFIFNSLNSIEYFIISNEQERAADYLNRFSRLIRLILQNSKNTIVPLKDDLEALKLYIEMESMRFEYLFDYEIKTEKDLDTERIMLPPMLLQPYVENAIWHGLMQKKGPKGKLDLTIHQSNNHLVCIIEDNGIGREAASALKSKSVERRKSYGMKITSDRLSMLNKLAGANASVKVIDLKDERDQATGTRVELMIPLQGFLILPAALCNGWSLAVGLGSLARQSATKDQRTRTFTNSTVIKTKTMIKTIILDDEKHSVATLAWKLEKFCPEVDIIQQFTDASEALEYLREHPFDLLFLDIEMPRLNGFELLEELGEAVSFDVVLTTAYDEFGIRAVKANVLDYLLKPVQTQELKAAVEKHKQKRGKQSPAINSETKTEELKPKRAKIALATKESIEFVDPEDIILCSSDSNYTMIHLTEGRKKLISKTLKDVEEWLTPHGFFRAHHSHLVNLSHIKEYVRADGGYLLLSNGKTLPVARNRKEDLLNML